MLKEFSRFDNIYYCLECYLVLIRLVSVLRLDNVILVGQFCKPIEDNISFQKGWINVSLLIFNVGCRKKLIYDALLLIFFSKRANLLYLSIEFSQLLRIVWRTGDLLFLNYWPMFLSGIRSVRWSLTAKKERSVRHGIINQPFVIGTVVYWGGSLFSLAFQPLCRPFYMCNN